VSAAPIPDPRTAAGAAGLAELIADPARSVVAVDFDGTLAPIVRDPASARPAAGARAVLEELAERVGRCALVTGRPAAEAARLAGLDPAAGVLVVGHYGLQRWSAGRLDSPAPSPEVEAARSRLADVLRAAPPGVTLEDKTHSLAVHTRPAADPAAALEEVRPRLEQLARELGLEAVPGRYVVELRPRGVDKGSALRDLIAERDAHSVVYIGDDLGDLPAFDAVEAHRRSGGTGLTVASVDLAAEDGPAELAARADLLLGGPDRVVAFLASVAAAIGAG
jgi:trehalose 6-phosphate phosphatase